MRGILSGRLVDGGVCAETQRCYLCDVLAQLLKFKCALENSRNEYDYLSGCYFFYGVYFCFIRFSVAYCPKGMLAIRPDLLQFNVISFRKLYQAIMREFVLGLRTSPKHACERSNY